MRGGGIGRLLAVGDLGVALRFEPLDQLLAPLARRAERGGQPLGAAVEEMAVVLPGEADAAVEL